VLMAWRPNPVVHLELHTGDRPGARAFYAALCGWKGEWVGRKGTDEYLALDLAHNLGGGIVECGTGRPLWLPYVDVPDLSEATERAQALGADVLLEPREGPAGWRAVVASPAGGEVALWQHKR
jgi:uncharacterized protein